MFLEVSGSPDRKLLRGIYRCSVIKTLYLQESSFSGLLTKTALFTDWSSFLIKKNQVSVTTN